MELCKVCDQEIMRGDPYDPAIECEDGVFVHEECAGEYYQINAAQK